jgi:hypothetical protein
MAQDNDEPMMRSYSKLFTASLPIWLDFEPKSALIKSLKKLYNSCLDVQLLLPRMTLQSPTRKLMGLAAMLKLNASMNLRRLVFLLASELRVKNHSKRCRTLEWFSQKWRS